MPAGIDTSTGQAAFFSVGTPAWHRMGKVIREAANSADAIRLAGLDWDVLQLPVFAVQPGGEHDHDQRIECPGRFANVRSDTRRVLGIVSDSYRVFQNREAFDFMDEIVGDRLAMYDTAGALDEGRRIWMLARIPKEYWATPQDVVEPYVLLTNSHDGSLALRMFATSVRVVCQNTLNLALSRAGHEGVTIYHYGSLRDRVREARQKLGIITARFDQFDEELHAMVARQMVGAEVESYFDGLLPQPEEAQPRAKQIREETINAWRANFENERQTLPGIRGTAWAAYHSVSEWADHGRKVRGATDGQRWNSQLKSVWFGPANRIKQRAFSMALELSGSAS